MKVAQKAISFLPAPLIPYIEQGIIETRFSAVVAFADVSGFTKITEQLAAIGHEGAEALTAILNRYFTEMIGRIESAGGFVGKFGGDAMTIFFPSAFEDNMANVARRAIAASLDLQKAMAGFKQVETKAGIFSLGMKIGIAVGSVLFKVVGEQEGGREFLLAGIPLDRAAEAEHHGTAGEVILTPKIAKLCDACGTLLEDGFIRLKDDASPPTYEPYKPAIETKPDWAKLAKNFIDPPVYKRLELGLDSVGEIRRVSIIFMSFSGLDYDVDPAVGEKLDELYDWVYRVSKAYGGSINKVDMGDKGSKLIITFGTPIAHENDEELAVHCGLELVRGHEKVTRLGLEQKIGIATGVVFTGEVGAPSRQEYTVMGKAVNLAARIMANTETGQLFIDQATYDRAIYSFQFAEPSMVQFKGIEKPVPIYEVTGSADTERAKETAKRAPFIGRSDELEKLRKLVDEVIDENLRIAVIKGDAGIGKSRLTLEMLDYARKKSLHIGAGEALSYAKRTPYLVWISILRSLMGLPAAGSSSDSLKRLTKVVKSSDPNHEYRLPIIAGILGIECPENDITKHFDAQLRQENLFDFMVQYFNYLTVEHPVIVIFEDAQWIDRMSLSLIAYLMRNLANSPVMFLIVRRAYSRNFTSQDISTIEGSSVTVNIGLKEFNRKEAELLTLQELGAVSIEDRLMNLIFDSSHGNASFTEQFIANLKSLDRITQVPDPELEGFRVEAVGDITDVAVPDSLSSLIMSQLDRLGAEAKLTVRVAAVIGRQFAEEIVNGSYPVKIDRVAIRESLKELESRDIVNMTKDENFTNYFFKNLLTRDVAYDSLLFAHRREYHRRVGLSLEELFSDSLKEWYEELARHFYQSEDDDRASNYLGKAGDKAFDIYANDSAEDYYTRALERTSVERDSEQRFRLLNMRSKVYTLIGKSDEQKKDLDETLKIAKKRDDFTGQVSTLDNLARYYSRANQLKEMKEVIDQAREILNRIDYPIGRITINSKAGTWFFVQNKYQEALKQWESCQNEAARINDKRGHSVALSNCGLAYKALGDFNAALECYNRSVAIDRETGNKRTEAVTLGNIGVIHHQRGDFDKAAEAYQKSIEIARSIGSKQIQAYYLGNLAMIYQTKGQRERALDTHNELLKIVQMMGYVRGQVLTLGNIGTWYLEAGEFDQAMSHYKQTLGIAEKTGLKAEQPRILLNIGLTLHYQQKLDQAIEHLKKAVEMSIEVKNKPAEDFARRYLGFALIGGEMFDEAEKEFIAAQEIASSIGSKVGIAAAKIGLGWLKANRDTDLTLIEEGIEEVIKLGDTETVINGKIQLAKLLMRKKETKNDAEKLLNDALTAARDGGYRCDEMIIDNLLQNLRNK